MERTRRVIVLGSTGSIGRQTLEVVAHLNRLWPGSLRVVGLAARNSAELLLEQASAWGVHAAALADESVRIGACGCRLLRGEGAAEELVRTVEADVVVGAMVGAAGLPATLAAVELGRDVALANKETLVAAGALVVPAAWKSGARLLPVDSEHCALWQCLEPSVRGEGGVVPPMRPGELDGVVRRVVLTASGGPFRTWSREATQTATAEAALNHPTWRMGPKVTIDSASLTNKALEIIEAHWLFGLGGERIAAVIHPRSLVHGLVEFVDGTFTAQIGPPDMRSPIQHALTYPRRAAGAGPGLALEALSKLEFEPIDVEKYPAVGLAYEVIARGGTSGAVFNAANEEAVREFLESARSDRPMPFGAITRVTAEALRAVEPAPVRGLEDVLAADAAARRWVRERLAGMAR